MKSGWHCRKVPRNCQTFVVTSLVLVAALPMQGVPLAHGSCAVEAGAGSPTGAFTRHLGAGCTDRERETRAVRADDLLAALQAGRGIDLKGVVVTGDLMLDRLPVVESGTLAGRSVLLDEVVRDRQSPELRVIAGPISITGSTVRGNLAANLRRGLLVVTGPVTLADTTFDRSIDLSHTVFLESVDFGGTTIGHEGFFIQAVFGKGARFEKTAFGVHSRFHKAAFHGPVTFARASFNGLAEFLETSFRQDASFARAFFKMGTGFSGSRFEGQLDFSEAVFEREAFFTFARFDGDASFRGATFRAQADFSDAQFNGVDDFSKAFFGAEPKFNRIRESGNRASPRVNSDGIQDPRVLYGIAGTLLLLTLILVLTLRSK